MKAACKVLNVDPVSVTKKRMKDKDIAIGLSKTLGCKVLYIKGAQKGRMSVDAIKKTIGKPDRWLSRAAMMQSSETRYQRSRWIVITDAKNLHELLSERRSMPTSKTFDVQEISASNVL